eukprot:Gb_07571 [translate_table: standard]
MPYICCHAFIMNKSFCGTQTTRKISSLIPEVEK